MGAESIGRMGYWLRGHEGMIFPPLSFHAKGETVGPLLIDAQSASWPTSQSALEFATLIQYHIQ